MTTPEQGAAGGGLGPAGGAAVARIGTVLDEPATGTAMPGFFRVELDKLPQLRTDLEAVKAKYDDIRRESFRLRHIPAPGTDEVSTRAATELGALAGDESGQLGWCADQARARVQDMLDQVNGIVNSYRSVEDANEMGR